MVLQANGLGKNEQRLQFVDPLNRRSLSFHSPLAVTWCICLHPGSCSLTSGAAQWESADSCDQPAGVTS